MKLKKYTSFFRLRCVTGLQYRAAALAGISTQFAWGFLIIFAYHAFYRSDPTAFPMTLQATVNYTWIQQAFLAMFATWVLDGDILEEITSGSISYSLCRPVDLYAMWYTKSLSGRISKVALRAVPRVQRRYCRHERRFRRRLTNLLAARPGAWRSHPHEKCAEAGSDSGRISGTTSRSAARQIVRVLQYTKKGVIYETIL